MLILSRKSHKIREYSLKGREVGSLNLSLFIPEPVKAEGLTLLPGGDIYVCSEPNLIHVFSKTGNKIDGRTAYKKRRHIGSLGTVFAETGHRDLFWDETAGS